MFDSIPAGWEQTTIGDVAKAFAGGTPSRSRPEYYGPGIPWLKSGEVRAGRIETTDESITELGLRESSARIAKAGTPVVAMYGATAGQAGILAIDAAMNQAVLAVVPIPKVIDAEFCYQFLRSNSAKLLDRTQGSGQPNLSKALIDGLEISLPPLDEQRRIAEVLRSVDDALSTAKAAQFQSNKVKQRLLDELCFGHADAGPKTSTEIGLIPTDWNVVNLGDVLAEIRYGTSAKCEATAESGLPVLRIPNVVQGRVEYSDLKYTTVSEADFRRLVLHDGDIVLVRTNGNPTYVGRNALISAPKCSLLFASYLIRLRCNKKLAWPPFIHAVFNSEQVRAKILKSATTSAGNYNINTESLKSLMIPLPPLPLQREISNIITAAIVAVDASESTVKLKEQLSSTLASDLLSGRVRVPA